MSLENEVPGELDSESYDLARVSSSGSGLAQSPPALPERPANKPPTTPATQWKPSAKSVEEPLAEGLSNEDLWMLIRRFNKQVYHVKALESSTADLDLNRADDEQFPPEKLRITLERFYTSVVVGVIEFFRHIGRLRSWKEPRRTALFLGIYLGSWWMDLLIPTFLSLLIALILFPPLRPFLFPEPKPDDPSAKDKVNNEQPESQDSLTHAPEAHKGEAAELEAKNLIDSVAKVALESAAGKYGQAVVEEEPEEIQPPEALPRVDSNTPDTPTEGAPDDKTKKPIKKKVSHATDQAMRVLSDITDVYEKFCNLFTPTPPFYLVLPRLRLAGILSIMAAIVPFSSSYWIIKSIGFTIGLGFFGDPLFVRCLAYLNENVPWWNQAIDIQRTLLPGVPTNAQLTLALLRIGEINSSPLPPPPKVAVPIWPMPRKKSKALSIQDEEVTTVSSPQSSTSDLLPPPKPKRRFIWKVMSFFRRTIAATIKGHMAIDRAMAIAGSAHTKNLLGMLQNRHFASAPFGPLKFDAKYERKRGAAVIDSQKEPPILYFTTYQSAGLDDLSIESRKKGSVLFQMPITEIRELKKTEGLGWKGKLVVELTAGSKDAAAGLVINGEQEGQSFHLTGMRSRNQLFNRLVAMDAQYWESW